MRCSGLANVLSGVALILRTSSGPAFRADHTVIETGHHRLPNGTISGVSASDGYRPAPSVPLDRRTTGYGATSSLPDALAEVSKLNGHRPLSLDGVNGSKCPSRAIRGHARE